MFLREPSHILILVIIVVLIFAAPKLPGMAKNIGKSMKIFKSEVRDLRDDKSEAEGDETTPQRPLEGKIVENEGQRNSTAAGSQSPRSEA